MESIINNRHDSSGKSIPSYLFIITSVFSIFPAFKSDIRVKIFFVPEIVEPNT